MMTPSAILILLSGGFAFGVTLVAAAFVPAVPKLADLLDDRTQAAVRVPILSKVTPSMPHADLALAGTPVERFLVQRFFLAVVGALWIPLLAAVLSLDDVAPPWFLTSALLIATAACGWFLPTVTLKAKVARVRREIRTVAAAYCRLVALGRQGGRGPVEALRFPVSLGDGWAFHRIREAMDEAELLGDMPWAGLERLGDATHVRELQDLAHIVAGAGQDGTGIVASLRAKADSIDQALNAERATGSSIRSDRMDLPLALLGLAFIAFLAFPGIYTMLGS
ncbi:type II secretion system protein [Amycolatopsis sp. NPDC047767]|uniref:type II secretion system protein n=1 Tax=Amycolatopsis sp. NPDC047767 TaxID=3156765 RepID=UPI0034572F32